MVFFLKKYSDSQCCWKKYSDFGGGKKKKSDSEFLSYNLMLNSCCLKKNFWTKQKTITPPFQVKWSVPNWNIVESGIKHHQRNKKSNKTNFCGYEENMYFRGYIYICGSTAIVSIYGINIRWILFNFVVWCYQWSLRILVCHE